MNQGACTPEATETLGDFVERVYIPNLESRLRASTLKGYRARWESQLKARCGHFRLREFRTPGAPEGQETYAYSLGEVSRMLLYLPQPAKGLVAVADFSGLRRSELAGLLWENYRDGEIMVTRSVWEGHISEPKTRKSKAPVPVITPLAQILDAWHQQCGNPTSSVMFASGKGTPLNLNNVLHRVILPMLRKVGIEWHGWHAFRRGLATNLHCLGVQDKVTQSILRHSNVAVTQACYIKTVDADSTAAMKLLEAVLCTQSAPATASEQPQRLN